MKFIFSVLLLLIPFGANSQEIYIDEDFNLQFDYPRADIVDRYDKNQKFSKTIFIFGKKPDSSTVQLIFESSSNTIDKFLIKSRDERKRGDYEKEVTEKQYQLKNGGKGVEITRDMKQRESIIHYFVFSPMSNILLSLYFVESTDRYGKKSKVQSRAKEAYNVMLLSLAK